MQPIQTRYRIFYFILSLLILVLLSGMGYFVWQSQVNMSNEVNGPVNDPNILSGYIYFNDDEEANLRSRFMEFSIENNKIDLFKEDTTKYLTTLTPIDVNSYAYLSAPFQPNDQYAFPYVDYKTLVVSSNGTETTRFEDFDVSLIKDLDWDPNNKKFAFSGLSQENVFKEKQGEEVDYININNFSVYYEDETGSLSEISTAVSPKWSDDGSQLYYLDRDGFSALDVSSGKTYLLVPYSSQMSRRASFAFTSDKQYLIIGVPRQDHLSLFKVNTYPIVDLEFVKEVSIPEANPPYNLFSVGTADQVAFLRYNENGLATVTSYDVSADIFTDHLSVPTNYSYSLEPVWSQTQLRP